MKFEPLEIEGAYVLDLEPRIDERGFFARSFCEREFAEHGLRPVVAQANVAYNARVGTLRGMHYRVPAAGETKVVRCVAGAIYDVLIDLRLESPTYLRHVGVELSARNRRALYVPTLVAHGYATLVDDVEVTYLMGAPYAPGSERGVRYDDPAFGIKWPVPIATVSAKDRTWPLFEEGVPAHG